jgi:hypothetical protein
VAETHKVMWHPNAIRRAVERVSAAVMSKDADPDAWYQVGGKRVSWMDLACLVDAGRAVLDDTDQADATMSPPTKPRTCGQDEGCTGITCGLFEQHPGGHEGATTETQRQYIGYPLTVHWPRNPYDICRPPLSEVVEDGAS